MCAATFGFLQQLQLFAAQRAKQTFKHSLHQPLFGAEVVIHRRQVDLSLEHDVAEGSAFKAELREGMFGGIENLVRSVLDSRGHVY